MCLVFEVKQTLDAFAYGYPHTHRKLQLNQVLPALIFNIKTNYFYIIFTGIDSLIFMNKSPTRTQPCQRCHLYHALSVKTKEQVLKQTINEI
jgi:hypothetical protein